MRSIDACAETDFFCDEGTGYNSSGNWNDNIADLSWGSTEDFEDKNYWNGQSEPFLIFEGIITSTDM